MATTKVYISSPHKSLVFLKWWRLNIGPSVSRVVTLEEHFAVWTEAAFLKGQEDGNH